MGWTENSSWRQPVLGSNLVPAWETLNASSGISEPQSLLRSTNPSFPAFQVTVPIVCRLHRCLRLPGDVRDRKCLVQQLAL